MRCSTPAHPLIHVHSQALPSVLLCLEDACARSLRPITNIAKSQAIEDTISTDLSSFVSTWRSVSTSLDSRLLDFRPFHCTRCTKILPGLTTSSSSLVDRQLRSILTHSHTLALFCQLRAGMHARPANVTAHQPPHHAHCAQPRLLTCLSRGRAARPTPITKDVCRHCASWLTSTVTIGNLLQGCC